MNNTIKNCLHSAYLRNDYCLNERVSDCRIQRNEEINKQFVRDSCNVPGTIINYYPLVNSRVLFISKYYYV